MKRRICVFLTVLSCCVSFAQDGLSSFLEEIQGRTVELKVRWTVSGERGKNSGTSQIKFRDGKYCITAAGMKLYCDGTTLWTVDSSSKEVVVGPAPEVDLNRPETLLPVCGLNPQKSKVDTRYDAGGKLSGFSAVLKDGTVVNIEKTGLRLSDEYNPSWFTFDVSGLGSAWVVTDLR